MTPATLIALMGAFTMQAMRSSNIEPAALHPLPIVRSVTDHWPVKKEGASLGVEVSSRAAIVMDAETGAVLFEKNADESLSIASLTKLVTAMTYLDQNPDLKAAVTFQDEDDGAIG